MKREGGPEHEGREGQSTKGGRARARREGGPEHEGREGQSMKGGRARA